MDNQQEFTKRFCPHRGIGKDNTLEGITLGLELKPYLLEFDIQLYDHALHLGHPPVVNTAATLAQALGLYTETKTMPKVDMKLTKSGMEASLALLIVELNKWSPKKVLVNIAGELHDPDAYMAAESTLLQGTGSHVLLNIDIARYVGKTNSEIGTHIGNLKRTPFSLSPNLESDIPAAVTFALKHRIPHIHFWSSFDKRYTREHLYKVMRSVLDSGLEVYFDMKTKNIADWPELQ